jgi:hypothetical protein
LKSLVTDSILDGLKDSIVVEDLGTRGLPIVTGLQPDVNSNVTLAAMLRNVEGFWLSSSQPLCRSVRWISRGLGGVQAPSGSGVSGLSEPLNRSETLKVCVSLEDDESAYAYA